MSDPTLRVDLGDPDTAPPVALGGFEDGGTGATENLKRSEHLLLLINKHFPVYIKYKDFLYALPFIFALLYMVYPNVALLLILMFIWIGVSVYIDGIKTPKEVFEVFAKDVAVSSSTLWLIKNTSLENHTYIEFYKLLMQEFFVLKELEDRES